MTIDVPVIWATNRNRTGDTFGDDIHEDGAAMVHSGVAVLRGVDPVRAVHVQSIESDEVSIETLGLQADGADAFAEALADAVVKHGLDAVIYLHGYDTRFEEALFYAAQLRLGFDFSRHRLINNPDRRRHALRMPKGFVAAAITWPSDGLWTRYRGDRREAKRAHPLIGALLAALQRRMEADTPSLDGFDRQADALAALADRQEPGQIHLVAQSMGAFILAHGVQAYFDGGPGDAVLSPFGQVFLTGADVEDEALEPIGRLARLPDLADQPSVYFNRYDLAGKASRFTQLFRRRMSESGLRNPAAAPAAVEVEVTGVIEQFRDRFGHFYARVNRTVQDDMLLAICGTPPARIPGRQPTEYPNAFRL